MERKRGRQKPWVRPKMYLLTIFFIKSICPTIARGKYIILTWTTFIIWCILFWFFLILNSMPRYHFYASFSLLSFYLSPLLSFMFMFIRICEPCLLTDILQLHFTLMLPGVLHNKYMINWNFLYFILRMNLKHMCYHSGVIRM